MKDGINISSTRSEGHPRSKASSLGPEIWEMAQAKGLDKELGTKGKTPWATLEQCSTSMSETTPILFLSRLAHAPNGFSCTHW